MPQTREHLSILDLLGVDKGVVAITKRDLVDDELLELASLEIAETIKGTTLAGASIVAVSAVTGEGLPALLAAIDRILESATPRPDRGRPRLPIDRVFTIAGFGTVVTGTLVDGHLSVGQTVEVLPERLTSRIRGLEVHKQRLDTALPGSRVAANLTGLSPDELKRGSVLTSPGWLSPSIALDVQLRLLPDLPRPLAHNATVSFHTGAAEVTARVRLLGKEKLAPGETGWAQLVLSGPVAVVRGDPFIIRSPIATLGGGRVVDTQARRHRRLSGATLAHLEAQGSGQAEAVLLATLDSRGPMELGAAASQAGLSPGEREPVVQGLMEQGRLVVLGRGEHRWAYSPQAWARLAGRVTKVLADYHRRSPLRRGMPREELKTRLGLPPSGLADWVERLAREGILIEEGQVVRLPAHSVALKPEQQAAVNSFLDGLSRHPYSPPGESLPSPELLNMLIEQGQVVKVSEGVFFAAAAYQKMVDGVVNHLKAQGKITVAEVRDMFGTSRKYALALMEHLDGKGLTRRVGDYRVLK